jgi:DNA-binding response OmpR family regulator
MSIKKNIKQSKINYLGNLEGKDAFLRFFQDSSNIDFNAYSHKMACIEASISNMPDILLIDADSFDENIFSIMKVLRNPEVCKKASFPVLFLKSSITERIANEISDSGVDCLLLKPFNYGVLLSRINAMVLSANNMVEGDGIMHPVPRVQYEKAQKKQHAEETHMWLV